MEIVEDKEGRPIGGDGRLVLPAAYGHMAGVARGNRVVIVTVSYTHLTLPTKA